MASPAFRSVSNDTGASTGFTVTAPTGFVDTDVALLFTLVENPHSAFTINASWTQIFATDVGPFTYRVHWLRRSGAPNFAVSWTTSRYYEWVCIASSGCVTSGSPIDVSAAGTPGTTSIVDPPSVTINTAETLAYAVGTNWAGYGVTAAPTGYTNRFSPAAAYDQIIASKTLAAAGAENPDGFGNALGTDSSCGFTIALASVSGGGGGGGEVATPDHISTLSFPALCRKPKNDTRWTRGQGEQIWRKAA